MVIQTGLEGLTVFPGGHQRHLNLDLQSKISLAERSSKMRGMGRKTHLKE